MSQALDFVWREESFSQLQAVHVVTNQLQVNSHFAIVSNDGLSDRAKVGRKYIWADIQGLRVEPKMSRTDRNPRIRPKSVGDTSLGFQSPLRKYVSHRIANTASMMAADRQRIMDAGFGAFQRLAPPTIAQGEGSSAPLAPRAFRSRLPW